MNGIFWLASYPKSGNTWLRALLTNYLSATDQPADINDLEGLTAASRTLFDETLGFESSHLTAKEMDHYRPLVYTRWAEEFPGPLFVKVHDAFRTNDDGRPLFPRPVTAGVVYLVRNPLDVAVSYAHHMHRPVDRAIEEMASDGHEMWPSKHGTGGQLTQRLLSWSSHVRSWMDESSLRLHLVRYEDMLERPVETFDGVLTFFGIQVEQDLAERSVARSAFDKLRAQERANGFSEKQPTSPSFFRSGRAGTWRESLTHSQVDRIVADHREQMCRFGYVSESGCDEKGADGGQ